MEKLTQLKLETQGDETKHFQELVVAFAAGAISLVVGLFVVRVVGRSSTSVRTVAEDVSAEPLVTFEM